MIDVCRLQIMYRPNFRSQSSYIFVHSTSSATCQGYKMKNNRGFDEFGEYSAVTEMETVSPHKQRFTDPVCLRSVYDPCTSLDMCPKVGGAAVPFSFFPLPSNRHNRRCGDCLEGKGENYQVCSVQYCVQQLCTVRCTHI